MKEKELSELLRLSGEGKVYFAHEGDNPLEAVAIIGALKIEKYQPILSDEKPEYSIVLIGKRGDENAADCDVPKS